MLLIIIVSIGLKLYFMMHLRKVIIIKLSMVFIRPFRSV